MKRAIWIALWLLLAGTIGLSFVRPHEMVSPGNLMPAHRALQDDCFACHAPFRGASAKRCTNCHVVAEIGLRTTKGQPIPKSNRKPLFHQALAEPDCMACHSDHPKAPLSRTAAVRFDHALLKADLRARCQSCHTAPRDELHGGQQSPCSTCHQTTAWKPATFNHDRYFALDRDHNTRCTTCHQGGNFRRYTCYGCHEHQPADIIAEHREEGITRIDNCVRCHRSAHGEVEGRGEGGREGEREGEGHDDD